MLLLFLSQTHLLDLPLSGQQLPGPRLRLLLLPHPGHAGRQPLLHLLVSGTGGGVRRRAAHHSSSPQAALVGVKDGVREVTRTNVTTEPRNPACSLSIFPKLESFKIVVTGNTGQKLNRRRTNTISLQSS